MSTNRVNGILILYLKVHRKTFITLSILILKKFADIRDFDNLYNITY